MHHSTETPPRPTLREAIIEYLDAFDNRRLRVGAMTPFATLVDIINDLDPKDDRPIAEAARKFERVGRGFNSADAVDTAREEMRKALTVKNPSKLARAVQEYLADYDCSSSRTHASIRTMFDTAQGRSTTLAMAVREYRHAPHSRFTKTLTRLREALAAELGQPSELVQTLRAWLSAAPGGEAWAAASRCQRALQNRTDAFAAATREALFKTQAVEQLLTMWTDADGNERIVPLTLAQAVQAYLTAYNGNVGDDASAYNVNQKLHLICTIARDLDTPLAIAVRQFKAAVGSKIITALSDLRMQLAAEIARTPIGEDSLAAAVSDWLNTTSRCCARSRSRYDRRDQPARGAHQEARECGRE
jgi:hypothetical protein